MIVALALIFSELSLLAFGGGNSVLPEMQRHMVQVQHWMTAPQFAAMFALAQAAPGPNMMIVPLIGWHVAGWQGALVSSVAMFGPSSLLTGVALHLWQRFQDRPWRGAIQAGLVPLTAGLVAASAVVITQSSARTPMLAAIALGSAAAMLRARMHPLVVLAAGALVGLSGLGQG